MRHALLLLALLSACGKAATAPDAGPPPQHPHDDVLTLFHAQLKATHNSYHLKGDTDLVAWSYSHAPLDVQAEKQGVRGFELDLHYKPDTDTLEVFHVESLDEKTTCRKFVDCLGKLKAWSDAHPLHLPLVIHLEPKSDLTDAQQDPFIARTEKDILSVWGEGRLITPAMVQGDAATLGEAVSKRGWPTLAATRGKVLFAWDDSKATRSHYTHGGKDLLGRLIFVDSAPGEPLAAYAILNDVVGEANQKKIAAALAANMLVRVFADNEMVEPTKNDRSVLEAALASGAQIISTDVPAKVDGLEYFVEIPGGTPARCDPVTAKGDLPCSSEALEDPKLLQPR